METGMVVTGSSALLKELCDTTQRQAQSGDSRAQSVNGNRLIDFE